MQRFTGLIGIIVILGLAYLCSNNRKAIKPRIIISGIILQLVLAFFVLKTSAGERIFQSLGFFMTKLLSYSDKGASFAFGPLADQDKLTKVFGAEYGVIFFIKIISTIIFVAVLINIAYYLKIIQRVVSVLAKAVYRIMGVSGSEALSNVASAFLGQVEAQILIKAYLDGMTDSELLASMSGSMACISGGIMVVYISFGIPAAYLIAASLMAIPGALVISKIVIPETQPSQTLGAVQLQVTKEYHGIIDAITAGAAEGLRIGLNVIAMIIAFIALLSLINAGLGVIGKGLGHIMSLGFIGIDLNHLSLDSLLGSIFSVFAWTLGVPFKDIQTAGSLLGTKMVANEFIAYHSFAGMLGGGQLAPKTITILSFALCGFANFSSIGIQIGGISQLAPARRKDLVRLGMRALLCGTLASWLSAAIAGLLM